MSISVKDIAWIAGLLEGEGHFGMTNNQRSPMIMVSMTDLDVIEKIRFLIDRTSSISISQDKRKDSYKDMYRISINGQLAVEWMMTLYCLMGKRRQLKILEILIIWKQVVLKRSQVRTMKPAKRLINFFVSSGLTIEQAYERFDLITDMAQTNKPVS